MCHRHNAKPCQNILDSHLQPHEFHHFTSVLCSGMVFGDAMIHRSRFHRSRRVFWNFEPQLMVQLQHCHWNAWDMENFVTWKTLCYGNRKAPPFQCHPPAKIGTSLLSRWLGSHIMSWRMVVLGGIRWSSILMISGSIYKTFPPKRNLPLEASMLSKVKIFQFVNRPDISPKAWAIACATLWTQAMLKRYL